MKMSEESAVNVRSTSYYLARTTGHCWRCERSTQLLALALPPAHEKLHSDAPEDLWESAAAPAFLFLIGFLPATVQRRLARESAAFRLTQGLQATHNYWGNHCDHCGFLLGDFDVHCEPDAGFMPSSEAAAERIALTFIDEPFSAAAAGYALDPQFIEFMRKA
jgi:hypothetical protein